MHSLRSYNASMSKVFDEVREFIHFNDDDAARLRELSDVTRPHLPAVVNRFYDEILKSPSASQVLAGGPSQVNRLRGHLQSWLEGLFSGVYDQNYVQNRAAIGQVHVRIGLPQHFMFTAMEGIWQDLSRIVREAGGENVEARLTSLHKLITIETSLMLENYRASYASRIRQIEREAIRERLSRAEHLAEIGQLAASLAHEIKNPLAGISGAIQVLRDQLAPADPRRPILNEIMLQIGRVDGTVKDLLSFARPPVPQFRAFKLGEVIDRVAALLRQEPAFRQVQLECVSGIDVGLEADHRQIEQLLINLLLNAAHASKPGDAVRLRIAAAVDEVTLVIEDKGHGMEEEVLRRAFEPFYTTKARGTGLGLPICRKIVDAHGGSIQITSEIGRGTSVEVKLPRSRGPT